MHSIVTSAHLMRLLFFALSFCVFFSLLPPYYPSQLILLSLYSFSSLYHLLPFLFLPLCSFSSFYHLLPLILLSLCSFSSFYHLFPLILLSLCSFSSLPLSFLNPPPFLLDSPLSPLETKGYLYLSPKSPVSYIFASEYNQKKTVFPMEIYLLPSTRETLSYYGNKAKR